MAGWIWKKGNALTGYQKRYFELSGTELGYKKDAKDKVRSRLNKLDTPKLKAEACRRYSRENIPRPTHYRY